MCDGPVWESDAGDAFRSHCDASAAKLSQAFARYDAAGRALGTSPGDAAAPTAARPNYAGALGHAQALSLQAWTTAQDAEQNQRQSLSWLQTLYDAKPFGAAALSFPAPPPELPLCWGRRRTTPATRPPRNVVTTLAARIWWRHSGW
jgi:hypothetical protein